MSTCVVCGEPAEVGVSGRSGKYCSERCRKSQYGDPCVDCGAWTVYGAETKRVLEPCCRECANQRAVRAKVLKYEMVAEMREAGMLNVEIAEVLGTTATAIDSRVSQMRREGWSVAPTTYVPAFAREGLAGRVRVVR